MKTARGSIFITVIVSGLIAGHAPLHAQSTSAPAAAGGDDAPWNRGVALDRREAARALFLEGNRLYKVPLFARAAEQYRAALAQWKHPVFYFNLAQAQLNLGQQVEARANLEQAMKHGEAPLGAQQFQEAQKQREEVERQLGRIRIGCETPGAEVTLDGTALFTGPGRYEGWVEAKAHEVTAKKPGHLSEARRVAVSPGALQALDLKLITLSEAADGSRRWAKWKPWTVLGAGAAVTATSGILHALSYRNFKAYDRDFSGLECARTTGCTKDQIGDDLNGRLETAGRQQRLATRGYIAGGSIVVAGAVLLYMNRARLSEQEPTSMRKDTIAVVPAVSIDMLGFQMSLNY